VGSLLQYQVMGDSEDVLAAVRRRAEALAGGRPAELLAVLHPRFRWTSHRGEVFDRDSYLAANTCGVLVWRRQAVLRPTVVVTGEVAIVTGVVVDDVEHDGVAESRRMHITQTWLRENGTWRCLAGHAGPLLS
jgi:hypothetical protein